nr:tetratricopeptide repeat protein [Hyphomicrobium sp.]
RLALDLDQVNVAARMLEIADDPAKPDWKVISARGTVLAKQGEYKQAIPYYERALSLSPNQPSVLNNLAMAHAMGGDPKQAEELLRRASATPTVDSARMKQNLALVLGLQGRYDEAKSVTAGSPTAIAGAQNVDIVRNIVKLDPKAAPVQQPTAVAAAPADFKTQVSRAIASAPAAAASPAKPIVTLKPSAADQAAAPSNVWQSEVVAGVTPAEFKGSAR